MDELPYIQDTFSFIIEESAVKMYEKIMAQPKPFYPLFTGLQLLKEGTLAFNTDGIFAYAILKGMRNIFKLYAANSLIFEFVLISHTHRR